MKKYPIVALIALLILSLASFLYFSESRYFSKTDNTTTIVSLSVYRGGSVDGSKEIKLNDHAITQTIQTYAGEGATTVATGTLSAAGLGALKTSLDKHNFRQLKSDPTPGPDMVRSTITAVLDGSQYKLDCVTSRECILLADELFATLGDALSVGSDVH